jgi:D123
MNSTPESFAEETSNDTRDDGTSSLDDQTTTILPTIQDVVACQFSSWYPIFSNLPVKYKGRQNVTIKSHIIKPLPKEFIHYLLSNDQFILPQNTRTSSALLEANRHRSDKDAWSSDSDNDEHESGETNIAEPSSLSLSQQYSFPELNEQIRTALQTFSTKACIPKLNWSSPKDAIWMNGGTNTMECRTAGDIYLLLKASDFISFDLQHALTDVVVRNDRTTPQSTATTTTTVAKRNDVENDDEGTDTTETATATFTQQSLLLLSSSTLPSNFQFELVLRKYCNLYPSQEFRCFISYNKLIGISQRYQHYFYPFLQSCREDYVHLIYDFYTTVVDANWKYKMDKYTLDLYIDQQRRLWIIDFNVWGTRTDALLFHWSELVSLSEQVKFEQHRNGTMNAQVDDAVRNIDYRIVEASNSLDHQQPIHPNPLSNYKAPLDALFLGSSSVNTSDDATSATTFQDFMKLCVRPSTMMNDSSSSDSEVEEN